MFPDKFIPDRATAFALCVVLCFTLCACSRTTVPQPSPTPTVTEAAQLPEQYDYEPVEFRYTRKSLSPQVQYLYDTILTGLQAHAETIPDLYPDNDLILQAVNAIDRDCPEIFWFSGSGTIETSLINDVPVSACYIPKYTMDAEQAQQTRAIIDTWTQDCISTIPGNASRYEVVLKVYEYIIQHSDYRQVDQNSIVNIMRDGGGLCGCYAKTTQYLLNLLGIPCAYISGTASGQSHAWNLVWLSSDPCWLDTTWGDPVAVDGGSSVISYDYFCIGTKDLLRTHTWDNEVPIPEITDDSRSYYRINGLYFTDSNYIPALTAAMKNAVLQGKDTLQIRFSDELFAGAVYELLEEQEIFKILKEVSRDCGVDFSFDSGIWYSQNETMGSLTIGIPYQ